MRWSLVKLLLGVILAIAILMGAGVATALYFMFKVTTPPPKPIFANDKSSVTQRSPASKTAKRTTSPAKPSATPKTDSSPEPLALGTYKARVTWSQGLSLRSEPNLDAERTGSAAYNQLIVVLGESADKNWQRVRLEDGEQEGWIKAGNIQKEQ